MYEVFYSDYQRGLFAELWIPLLRLIGNHVRFTSSNTLLVVTELHIWQILLIA